MGIKRVAAVAGLAILGGLAGSAHAISSANYSIPFSVVNAGAAPMSSPGFTMLSSIGDGVASTPMSSAGNRAATGFIAQLYGVNFSCILDIDGNGKLDALSDGLMLLRAMFGLTGTAVTNNAIGQQATKTTWAEIQPLIHSAALDIDGNGTTDALTDGLMIIRALFGLTGTAVTNNALGQNATRVTWPAIRDYLNSVCGTAIQ